MRVLVVIGSTPVPLRRRLRRALRAAGTRVRRGVTVITNAEVVCVDGLHRVEAVIVRRMGSGSLIGVNASAIHEFGAAKEAAERGNVEERSRRYRKGAEPDRCDATFVKDRPPEFVPKNHPARLGRKLAADEAPRSGAGPPLANGR